LLRRKKNAPRNDTDWETYFFTDPKLAQSGLPASGGSLEGWIVVYCVLSRQKQANECIVGLLRYHHRSH